MQSRREIDATVPVSLLHLSHELVSAELSSHYHNKLLDSILAAVYIQQSSHDHGQARGVHLHDITNQIIAFYEQTNRIVTSYE